MVVCLNGRFLDAHKAKISVFDHGFFYGDGVYETMRTYNGKVFQIDLHLKRLRHSLKIAKIQIPWSFAELQDFVYKLLAKNRYPEARIRLMVSRGISETKGERFSPACASHPTLLIIIYPLSPFQPSPLRSGHVVFFKVERNFPNVKTTSLFPLILARLYAHEHGADDAFLVDHRGYVREGAASNFFVIKGGLLLTVDRHILLGTTRDFVLKLAKKICHIPVRFVQFFRKIDFWKADEVFLTNAPCGIVAVTKIENRLIADGKPGPVTFCLKEAFDQHCTKASF